jgi:hypothetical protein
MVCFALRVNLTKAQRFPYFSRALLKRTSSVDQYIVKIGTFQVASNLFPAKNEQMALSSSVHSEMSSITGL